MKKTLLTLIALFISAIAFAYDVEIDGIYYNLYNYNENKTASVTHNGNISCYDNKNLVIPDSIIHNDETYIITSIPSFYQSRITSISIPNGVTSIGKEYFYQCTSLRTIKLGNSVTSIGSQAFKTCVNLYSIEIATEIPPTVAYEGFQGVSATCQIKVPCGTIAAYRGAWNEFTNFEGNPHSLTAKSNDENMGKAFVTKKNTCDDITAQVTAQALPNYKFVKWSDGFVENPHTIYVTDNIEITAEFTPILYNLTLSAENGSVSGAGSYSYGTEVILTATPNDGYSFAKWSDGNTENPRTITITQDISLSAEFIANTHNVTLLSENGTGNGAGTYTHGTNATISVIPNEGYHFTQWSDGNTDNPRTIIITQDTTLTAICEINKYIISLSAENGVVIGAGEYMHGSEATLAAIPNNGYRFTKWSNGNTDNPRYIIVTQDITLSAILSLINDPSVNIENSPNSNISIFTTGNTLHIEGLESDYHILDATGRLIYSGNATTLTLPHGIYLITINGETQKIIL